jgi:hypothetical protein
MQSTFGGSGVQIQNGVLFGTAAPTTAVGLFPPVATAAQNLSATAPAAGQKKGCCSGCSQGSGMCHTEKKAIAGLFIIAALFLFYSLLK